MILYRCCRNVPERLISPSNWATNSVALEYFIDLCEERRIDCGDTIVVIDIPTPAETEIGPYTHIRGRKTETYDTEFTAPFGNDKNGWWSFNQPYKGLFRILAVIKVSSFNSLDEIDELDARFKPYNEWPQWLKDRMAKRV